MPSWLCFVKASSLLLLLLLLLHIHSKLVACVERTNDELKTHLTFLKVEYIFVISLFMYDNNK